MQIFGRLKLINIIWIDNKPIMQHNGFLKCGINLLKKIARQPSIKAHYKLPPVPGLSLLCQHLADSANGGTSITNTMSWYRR